jgi:hypothetical protein
VDLCLEATHNILTLVLDLLRQYLEGASVDVGLDYFGSHSGVLICLALRLLDPGFFFVTSLSGLGSLQLYERMHFRSLRTPAIHIATLNLPRTAPDTEVSVM